MAKFKFQALGPDGATIAGVEEGLTVGGVRRALLERQLTPIEVTEKKGALQFELTRKKVGKRELMHFSRQMAVFMRAGIPVLEALEIMTEELDDKVLQRVIAEMAESLRAGETFAGAADEHPEAFPPYYLGILRSAELTGNLDTVLDQLAVYIEREVEARRKITSALIYPAIVLVLAIVAVIIITVFVLPRFKSFFTSLHATLPLPTRILLNVADFVGRDWFVPVGVVVALVGLGIYLNVTTQGGEIRDKLMLKLPVLGDLVKTAVLERFCRILHSMVSAGVPMPVALAVTSDATANRVFRRGISGARDAMLRGEGLAGPLSRTQLFPAAARHMFLVGESTGTLDDQLEEASKYFDSELDYKLKQFTSLFEPAVIVFVGLIVGFVAIALVSAMYGIYRQVHV